MSDDETLLERWFRRKGTANQRPRERSTSENADTGRGSEAPVGSLLLATQASFDPSQLPPIESIGADSDIRAFLAVGVPADITRAALRRTWSSDHVIRDFVGLSENFWDFNAPGAMPGFGSIDEEVVGRLMARLFGEPNATPVAPRQTGRATDRVDEPNLGAKNDSIVRLMAPTPMVYYRPQQQEALDAVDDMTQSSIASQFDVPSRSDPATRRRSHGSSTQTPIVAVDRGARIW